MNRLHNAAQTAAAWFLVVLAITVGTAAGNLVASRLMVGVWWWEL